MSSEFRIPSEDDLKRKYGIQQNEHIDIQTSDAPPSPGWVQELGGYLEQAADYFGVPTFLLKKPTAIGVIVIAVFFVPYWGPKALDEIKTAVVVSKETWFGAFSQLPAQNPEPASTYAVVTPHANTVQQSLTAINTGHFQTGTSWYPISGTLSHIMTGEHV